MSMPSVWKFTKSNIKIPELIQHWYKMVPLCYSDDLMVENQTSESKNETKRAYQIYWFPNKTIESV